MFGFFFIQRTYIRVITVTRVLLKLITVRKNTEERAVDNDITNVEVQKSQFPISNSEPMIMFDEYLTRLHFQPEVNLTNISEFKPASLLSGRKM